MLNFWSLTAEEIHQGIELIENPHLAHPNHPLKQFVSDLTLQELAYLWLDSNQDLNLMKLKYFDTIQQLQTVSPATRRINGHA